MISFRPATMDDADWLLALRNDERAREMSRTSSEVSAEGHQSWLKIRVDNPDHQLLIAEASGVPIGSVRFDRTPSKHEGYEVSIIIAPSCRQAGLGLATLDAACDDWGSRWLYAEIKYNNLASHRIFTACGFEQIGSYGLWTQWRRLPIK